MKVYKSTILIILKIPKMEYTKVHKSTHSEFFYVPPYMKNMIFTIKKVYHSNKTILFFYP